MNLAAPHVGYVIAAYAIAFVVIAAMILGTLIDYRTLKRNLERIAARANNGQDASV
ncbi:MAG: heme exporter protein CcmD [Methylovirgula sp.]|nr:heme exporter protein CcmD [Methylovirgula sp.]